MSKGIRATASTLKTFLGVEAGHASALEAAIVASRRHRGHDTVLEQAIEAIGGHDVTKNERYAWVERNPGQLTVYVDLKTDEYYIGAM